MAGYTHTLLCIHCIYIYHVSFPSQKEVWLKSQLSSSESGGPAVVRLETSTSNDRVTASLQCIGQQELQFPYLCTEKNREMRCMSGIHDK